MFLTRHLFTLAASVLAFGFLHQATIAQEESELNRIILPTEKPEAFRIETAERLELRRKIGQLLLIGFQGNDISDRPIKRLGEQIEGGEVGGVLFLGHNIPRSGQDIQDTLNFLKAKQTAGGHNGLLIALDQEGGKIARLKPWHGIEKLPSAYKMPLKSSDEAYTIYKNLACELAELGFNWNLGPVIDLASNPRNPVIARLERAFSADTGTVIEYGNAFVRAHKACGVATSIKHFPGHGSSGTDSHKGLADITETWKKNELEPYRAMIDEAGTAEAVMVGHLVHRDVDAERPSSLSPAWIDGKLRGELGYTGLVLTDDLDMRAVSNEYTHEQAGLAALLAGNDIIMIANGIERLNHLPRLVTSYILDAMDKGEISQERLEQSFVRVQRFKDDLGLKADR